MQAEQFHSLKIQCPNCLKGATITDVQFSTKGAVKIKLICVVCGVDLTLNTSWDNIICYCLAQEPLVVSTVFEAVKTLQ